MSDAATPISYEVLKEGTPVLTGSGEEIGRVEHVLADESLDLFDGLVVETCEGRRFVDARRIGSITTAAVHTTLEDADLPNLPKPHGDEVFDADPLEHDVDGVHAWFGRMFEREHWIQRKDE